MDYVTRGSHLLVALENTQFYMSIEDKLHIVAASIEPKISFEALKRIILGDLKVSVKHIKSLQALGVKMSVPLVDDDEDEEEEEEIEEIEEEEEEDNTSTPSPIHG